MCYNKESRKVLMDIFQEKENLRRLLKIDEKKRQIEEIQKEMSKPDFWQDKEEASQKSRYLSNLQEEINLFEKAQTKEELAKLEKKTLFSGPYDANSALLSLHAGAGGTEAQDWAEMLLRMYRRFAQNKNFQERILEISPGEEAGVKRAVLEISGLYAFGNLKGEAGVHRLVRISPFDADRARHTSFVLVEVIPEIEKETQIQLEPKDLKIEVFRSRGHGGQGVNTTDSAVRITHLPTKIIVACQNERSQLQNKNTALKVLKFRLLQRKLQERKVKEAQLRGEHLPAEWGRQIRSYVLHPYTMVKDHRTGLEIASAKEVLEGNLEPFVESYLKCLTNYE